MATVKVVVIGASGVGKTSLRGQYISGRFSNGYRATIGADFITKTLPHPSKTGETLALQIWDTAGQERFSSLSSAFFRGADAAVLMFDVNEPNTMEALTKWWGEFRDKAPVTDGDLEDFCCVVVGNKTDIVKDGRRVTETEATRFLHELIPLPSRASSPEGMDGEHEEDNDADDEEDEDEDDALASSQLTERPRRFSSTSSTSSSPVRTASIAILSPQSQHQRHHLISPSSTHFNSKSRSRSRTSESSRFHNGTVTTSHTTLTIYHTPSSSLFDVYQSARSSPEPTSPGIGRSSARRMTSGSASSGSAVTITPSLFKREHTAAAAGSSPHENNPMASLSSFSRLARGPKLFFTSAKTGEGVKDVFEFVAARVVQRWEREERRMSMRESDGFRPSVNGTRRGGGVSAAETIRLGLGLKKKGNGLGCCGS